MSENPIVIAQKLGQSIWQDGINRDQLRSGILAQRIASWGIVGVNWNRGHFKQAISTSGHYDESIAKRLTLEPVEIFEQLVIEDIQEAADLLRPLYDNGERHDGYISVDLSPHLAEDGDTMLDEAKRIFAAIDRPNVMIKIPATPACLPAIESAIAAGINVNITLIFSVNTYREVAERYLSGLEQRLDSGEPIDHIASVASFFVSRIDSMVDQQLENNIRSGQGTLDWDRVRANDELLGKIAVANAQLAYEAYSDLLDDARFKKLSDAGASPQRLLWASTTPKNAKFPSTYYIDSLIGNQTISIASLGTLRAFLNHGTPDLSLTTPATTARKTLQKLTYVGIDLQSVARFLQEDGIDIAVDEYRKLLKAIEGKRDMLRVGVIKQQQGIVGGYEPGVRRLVDKLDKARINQRLWQKDTTLWKESTVYRDSILGRLGWLHCLDNDTINRARLATLQASAHEWAHVVVLGMGGSSIAPTVFADVFGRQTGYPQLLILDSTDPDHINTIQSQLDLKKTLFIVSSKSGITEETDAFRLYFYDLMSQLVGADTAGQHFIAITDENTPLHEIAKAHNYKEIFLNPSDIGGRFAAMTYVGLVPAALMGLDLDKLFSYAERMNQALDEIIPAHGHPGIWLGAVLGYLANRGVDKLGLLFGDTLDSFAFWVEQLVAESTGKDGKGILPISSATVGHPHDYDDDRLIVYLRLPSEAGKFDDNVKALWEAGLPVFIINIDDPYALGGEFLRWQYAVAVASHILEVNAFDEPNVEESKIQTAQLLEYYKRNGYLSQAVPFWEDDDLALYVDENAGEMLAKICEQRNYSDTELAGLLAAHISFARSGDYIALQAYLSPSETHDQLLRNIRRRLRHSTTRAVTLGYGPRYLHSTGQYQKGAANRGIFLQITVENRHDITIPKKDYTFGLLKQAQALGDELSLEKREQFFVRLHIKGDIQHGLQKILDAIAITEEKQT